MKISNKVLSIVLLISLIFNGYMFLQNKEKTQNLNTKIDGLIEENYVKDYEISKLNNVIEEKESAIYEIGIELQYIKDMRK